MQFPGLAPGYAELLEPNSSLDSTQVQPSLAVKCDDYMLDDGTPDPPVAAAEMVFPSVMPDASA